MTTWCLQVQLHLRAISADEYDDAVRWAPSSCPLFAMGDRRSGRELLEQADADAVRPRWPRFPPYPITMARGAQAACAWSPPPIQRQREFLLQQRGWTTSRVPVSIGGPGHRDWQWPWTEPPAGDGFGLGSG